MEGVGGFVLGECVCVGGEDDSGGLRISYSER